MERRRKNRRPRTKKLKGKDEKGRRFPRPSPLRPSDPRQPSTIASSLKVPRPACHGGSRAAQDGR
ncbi:hypothetical protein E2C01_012818 [Portunus trituberculatus]|uniref:Uncharacterized protein n=1 Tax=Portunus trituberculatus TaxID=210409 RepID=A0A5B7DF99_PORTR|nr:hypothetical protein [Portunus trituberculatus]